MSCGGLCPSPIKFGLTVGSCQNCTEKALPLYTATCMPELLSLITQFFGSYRNCDHFYSKPILYYTIFVKSIVIVDSSNYL